MNERKLEQLAGQVADDAAVEWDTYEEDRALAHALPAFRLIATVAGAFRDASSPRSTRVPDFRWGPFDVYERLGSGGFGDVFRAHDPRLDRDVALKLRHAVVGDELTTSRLFLDEARRLARVRHPNVVVIHGADVHDGRVGLWTDLVAGPSLQTVIDERGALPAPDVARMGAALASALSAIHDAGLIHGDVKPANVLLDGSDVRLIDFGAGRDRDSTAPQLFGSAAYVAPELLEGDPASPASDQFALGALLYCALAGRPPLDVANGNDAVDVAVPALSSVVDTPMALAKAIERAITSNARRRYPSATSFASALESAATPPRNIPRFLTSFIGRAGELSRLSDASEAHRLLTLLGPGGMGKTRLAAEWATSVATPDGAYWVDLAPLSSANVAAGILRATGVGPSDADELDVAVAFFNPRRAVVVLDNAEHVLDAVRTSATRLLAECPKLRIVVTSREATRIDGETILDVGALDVNEGADACRLFVERARAHLPSFVLNARTRRAVQDLCTRLDGVPLAIELAAARVRAFDVVDLVERLSSSLLTDPTRTDRHASIAAMVRWSADLAAEPEQRLLARLSVFAGSWSLDMAERVCADETLPRNQFGLAHSGLVDKSLIAIRDGDGGRRYYLLQIVRDVAAAELNSEDALAVRRRQRTALNDLLVDHRRTLLAGDPTEPLRVFERERPNLLDAIEWFASRRIDIEDAALLMTSAGRYWDRLALWPEAERMAELIMADLAPDAIRTRKWASFLTAAALFYSNARKDELNKTFLVAALGIFEDLEYGEGVAAVLASLSGNLMDMGDLVEAQAYVERALEAARAIDNPRRVCLALANASAIADRNNQLVRARKLGEEAIRFCREIGDNALLAHLLINRGRGLHCEGKVADARVAFEAALEAAERAREPQMTVVGTCDLIRLEWTPPSWDPILQRLASVESLAEELGNDTAIGDVLFTRAECDIRSGSPEVVGSVRRCLEFAYETEFQTYVEGGVRIVGLLALKRQDPAFAAWCLGATEGIADHYSHGGRGTPSEQARMEQAVETLSRTMDPAVRDAQWRRGAETPWDEVARTAIRCISSWS